MAMLEPIQVEKESQDFLGDLSHLPEGWYKVKIEASEIKDNASDGVRLELTFRLQAGEHEGRKLIGRYNVRHSNPKAVAIGRSGIAKCAKVAGFPGTLADSAVLHGRTLEILAKVKPREDSPGKFNNEIVDYRPWQTAAPAADDAATANAAAAVFG